MINHIGRRSNYSKREKYIWSFCDQTCGWDCSQMMLTPTTMLMLMTLDNSIWRISHDYIDSLAFMPNEAKCHVIRDSAHVKYPSLISTFSFAASCNSFLILVCCFWYCSSFSAFSLLASLDLNSIHLQIECYTGFSRYIAQPNKSPWAYKCEIFHNM